jgi:hypothetical protein
MKKKIPLKKSSLFIKCLDCQGICLNDDDSVCLFCGSKKTKRILVGSNVFKLAITDKFPQIKRGSVVLSRF